MSEAGVHFELYRHLADAIEDQPRRSHIEFGDIVPECSDGITGRADIVVFNTDGDPFLVIEAKKPDDNGNRDIDPYSPDVIRQAFRYAGSMGARYFATFNGDRLVLFNAWEEGRSLLERSTKSYDGITDLEVFVDAFLTDLAEIDEGEQNWDARDTAFVERVRSLHDFIHPELFTTLDNQLETNDEFYTEFVTWAQSSQGFEYEDADNDEQEEFRQEFAEQAAYLLINKIIFYKILENSPTYSEDVEPLAVSIHRVKEDLNDHFDLVVRDVDFEAVFQHDDIFDKLSLDRVNTHIREFILELDDRDLTQFDSDLIGQIYQDVIPPARRHEMGEYYTPPEVCDLITRLTITDGDKHVIDPACGSGGFLISAYHRLKELLPEEAGSHPQVLSQLAGVDINRFPAHLSVINLAIQDLSSYTEYVNIEVNDFFRIDPGAARLQRERATAEGGETETGYTDEMAQFDAVVGNPPYIRSQNISESVPAGEHLSNVNAEYMSDCDIFAYFITHATEFLADDGRIGFLVSDGWLQTKYGEDVQQFLLDNYVIESVIKFDHQLFEDALIGTNVIILQREPDAETRDANVTRFIRVKDHMEIDEMVELVRAEDEPDKMVRTDKYRLVTRDQESLHEVDKWSVFFIAPPAFFEIVETGASVPFTELASQRRGVTTGAVDFFFRKMTDVDDLGIEEYVSPVAKATGQIDRVLFSDEDAEEWGIVDVEELAAEALDTDRRFGEGDEDRFKRWLPDHDHGKLLEYVEWGEEQEEHTGRTCQNRDIWFVLEDLEEKYQTKILIPRFTWNVFRVSWNEADAIANDQFYNVTPDSDVDEKTLAAVLNTRLVWMFYELFGRTEGGEGMNRTEIKGYEIDDLPIPNLRAMSDEDKARIKQAFDDLLDRERELGYEVAPDEIEEELDELDEAVLEAIGLGDHVEEIKDAVRALLKMRQRSGGINTEVLVERGNDDEHEVFELPGVDATRENTTLGEYS